MGNDYNTLSQALLAKATRDMLGSLNAPTSRRLAMSQRLLRSQLEAMVADPDRADDLLTPFQRRVHAVVEDAERRINELANVINHPDGPEAGQQVLLGLVAPLIGSMIALEARVASIEFALNSDQPS